VIREVSETIATAQGKPRASWYRFMGDAKDEADFMVSSLNALYTAIDEDGKKMVLFKFTKKQKVIKRQSK
jgi:hypothetical protein